MSAPKWIGNALAVADLWTLTPGGTIVAGDQFKVTINGKTAIYVATGTTVASVTAGLAAMLNALDQSIYPEHAEYTAADATTACTMTADKAGVPGTITVNIVSAAGTFAAVHTTTGTGPNNWDNAANWDTGAVPVSTDTPVIENSAVDILYGLAQSAVTLTSLTIPRTYTGRIGLPTRNPNGYQEYRATYLAIGATTIDVGQSAGGGLKRFRHDAGAVATTWNVYGSGQPADTGLETILLKGTSASNVLNVTEGSVGVAVLGGETANLSGLLRVGYETNKASDAKVRCGSGVTLANVLQTGGQVEVNSAMTTVTRQGGTMTHRGTGGITALNNWGGTFNDESSGTYTTVLNDAEFDRRRVITAQTITTLRLYAGSKTWIPSQSVAPTFGVTLTNPFECVGCQLTDLAVFEVGPNKKYTFADI